MTGPQHYREGERLLRKAEGETPEWAATLAQLALAHFAAAQAAATAMCAVTGEAHMPEFNAWQEVAGS